MDHPIDSTPIAFSYIRFSSPEQAGGDSLRRQTAATEEWCERNGIRLDTSLSLRDLGVSAFRGAHRSDKFALGSFVKLVERGRIPKGSYLVVENLDRLSREDERTALKLWLNLLDAGINIVTLTPETIYRHEKSDMVDIMRAIIDLSRGHNESVVKSERITEAWAERKRLAREEGETLTSILPGWVELRDGKRCIKLGAGATIKRIFELAADGYGERRIVRKLTAEQRQPFGASGKWTIGYIHKLLTDRRLLGEFQPMTLAGEPDGEVIANYFPAVLTESEFYAAQRKRRKNPRRAATITEGERERIKTMFAAGASVRQIAESLGASKHKVYRALAALGLKKKHKPERTNGIYLFSEMVQDVETKQMFFIDTWTTPLRTYKVLRVDGGSSFPYVIFERALLHELNEIDPKTILEGANGHDTVVSLENELGELQAAIDSISEELDKNGESPTLYRRLRLKEARFAEVTKQLADARQKASNPLSASWAEAKSLLAALDNAADQEDARLRLRAALRRIIASIKMAVLVGPGRNRLALVDIEFAGEHAGRFRSLNIWYKPRPNGGWAVASAAGQGAPIECLPREEPDDPPGGNIVGVADWYQQLPAEPREWHPLPE